MGRLVLAGALALLCIAEGNAQSGSGVLAEVARVYPEAFSFYRELHQHPELSGQEKETSARLANGLRQLGYEVTTGVGGFGVVGVLENGPGPTVMLRTDLDALPVTEDTGLPYASVVRTRDATGAEVGVMHACGHDVHMAAWMATARIMIGDRARWSGTLVLVGQPAEETIAGAKAMIADGLFTRFPRPDYAIAVHDDARLPAGVVGAHPGPILTNSDPLSITIFGRGGHGARPESTVDPVVIAARVVVGLQTIVSREISPFDPAVVTVGAIHGGTKSNIIPDEVQLLLSVRSFTPAVRQRLLEAIARNVKAEAAAAGAPREPRIEKLDAATALVNDPGLTEIVSKALARELGSRVKAAPPEMASEDFSEYGKPGIPTLMIRVGVVEQSKHDAAMKSGDALPSLHSSKFAPDPEPTITSAIAAEVIALRTLMPKAGSRP